MSSSDGEVPGGVLRTVIEEHQYMDEFVDLLRRRLVVPLLRTHRLVSDSDSALNWTKDTSNI
ncbi:hypothetical protein CPB86DRAFT_785348 [Serendipita vermifera]|nr:hypothetical protein CPB86DRAFT_785348 [Serendipita vermifera]